MNAKGLVYDVSTVELFNRLGWRSIYELIIYHKCIFMYNVRRNNCPSYFTNHFQHVSQVQRYNLQNYDVNNFIKREPKLELFKFSIQYSGTVLWNNLPQRVKNSNSLSVFKILLCEYILATVIEF